MKKITLILFSVVTVLLLSACSTEGIPNTWDQIEERGYFIVGLDDTFAPMGFRDDSGELVGFDVDLAKEVSQRLGVEVRFQPIDWDAKVLELNSGTIDMIWNGLTITESRLEEMAFSNAYIANTQLVIVAAGSGIDLITDLTGLSVGVQTSSAAEEAVLANAISSELGELLTYDSYNQALLELENGVIDAVVIDEIMGRYIISQADEGIFEVASENFAEEEYGVGFRLESTDIRDQINQVLLDMINDGTASEISVTWFGEDIFLK
jgi:polar amino acid transport system substrate-binding protein